MFDYKRATPKEALKEIERIASETNGYKGFFVKKEYKNIPKILDDNEQLHSITSGTFKTSNNSTHTGVFILSDKRIILFDKGMLFGSTMVSLPFAKIDSISYETGMLVATVFIKNVNATFKLTNITKQGAVSFVDSTLRIMALEEQKNSNPSFQVVNAEEDKYSKLGKIAELLEKGILTQEEFESEKRKILNS